MKPFLKWAGGKTLLIAEIDRRLPNEAKASKFTCIEPLIISGMILF